MKITNIRVLNNFKVKLTNTKLSGVNASQSSVFEQGTRTPVIITEVPEEDFQEKFNLVFNYLINRYEPGWSAATIDLGKAATMQLLGISSAVNPLILGGTVSDAFNYTANNNSANIGWFDPLTHPKDFASAVLSAYKKFERARTPSSAKHKFIHYNLNGIDCQAYLPQGGNAFFGYHPEFNWRPGTTLPNLLYMGYTANYNNSICRTLIHSPYGNFTSPMNSLAGNWRRYPWLSDRYTAESFQFDMYLLSQENSTIRDLLSDYNVERSITGGVLVNGTGDAHLNTIYRGMCFPAGTYTKYPSYNDHGRTFGGFSANQVLVGSPWISFPNGITVSDWWANGLAGLCFNPETLVLFDGSTFPNNPTDFSSVFPRPPMTNVTGLSFGYGQSLLQSLNDLSSQYGNSMEFIAYLGCLPYGPGFEMRIPFGLYRDPTVEGNKEYFKWRLDASVSHWKEKFKSPIDGFAHVFIDASSIIERTYHQWQAPGYTLWTNIASSGASYVENIPVEWARDQYNYTFGDLGPNATAGVVLGVERFAQYMFKDDTSIINPSRNDQRRFNGDTEPRHWCLDDDKATDLFTSCSDMLLGQRKWGLTYSNSIWGMGVCGSSKLGEIFAACNSRHELNDSNKSLMSAFPFFYNTFVNVTDAGDIKWKRVPGTLYNATNAGVPWANDRRFKLFYLYPTLLALNMSILDHFHDGVGYYNSNETGWFDKSLGSILTQNMELSSIGNIVSNFPHQGRRTPTKPPQNFWTGIARTSEFELLYACMKGGITDGLDSLYFNELYEELKNGLIDPPDTSRTGFFRALDFAVFGVSWTPGAMGSDGQSLYPSIVPMIKPPALGPDGNLFTYRGSVDPGSTAGMPVNEFNQIFVPYCQQIPYERRVLLPNYWLLDGPPNQRPNTYFFKRLADGATYTGTAGGITFLSTDYTGGTWQFGDTEPLKFMTPWAYENRSVAKTSFKNFLNQAKSAGLVFPYVHDDCETLGALSPAGPIFSPLTEAQLISFASGQNSYQQIPDARHIHAIVNDPRFNGITSSITNRTMAQEFKHNYDQVLSIFGLGSCGASAEQILSFFTGATGRNDFRYAYGNGFDVLRIAYAYDSTNYIFCQGDLKTKIIGESLRETSGFEDCKVTSSELCTVNASEGKYGVDPFGHPIIRTHIPGYGHSTHSFGELANYQFNDRGYPPNDSTDPDIRYGKEFGWHPISEGGIRFDSIAYQAMISDLRKIRSMIRSRPQIFSEGLVVLINGNPNNGSAGARFTGNDGAKYYKEHIYHHCLSGVNYFVLFNKTNDMTLANEALVEWRNVSGNVVAVPCNDAGSTSGIDRIDLREAGTKMVATGAYTNDPNKRLWRLTVPVSVSALAKVGTSQPDLPNIITIPTDSRGVWLEAPASYGKPNYEPVSALYSYELEDNRRMYTIYNIGVNGAEQSVTEVWNSVTDTFIATFKGDPFPSGTRAYPWESNPANPSVSSPWHNVIYENCIDPYKWGSRAFYVYMPWGSFNTAWYLTPEIWRRTFTNLTGNTFAVPARWKGFTSAIKGLLEGTLAPAGKSAMNEPCNVMLYHGSNRGYYNYRFNSNALWDSFAGSTREKDSKYYEYLDSWTNALISMKSEDLTKGKLHITMDATSPSATPTSLPLYRSLGNGPYGYRSDELELSDWYVFNKLKDAGISVYYEARSPKSINRVGGLAVVQGVTGATLDVQWATQASHFEEYWLWYSNPSNADTNFDNHQKDSEHPGMVRMFGPNFPIRLDGDPNRDPFKTKLNVQLSDGRGVTIDHVNTLNTLYTPHYYLWMIYALSDNYRKYYNKSANSTVFKGIKLNAEHLIAYFYERIAKSNICISVFDGQNDPLDKYWRIPTTSADSFKPLFNLDSFNKSISGGGTGPLYGSIAGGNPLDGFWTQQGISYWNNNVLKTSFNNFINFLTSYSETHSPLGTTYGTDDLLFGEPQKFYGTTSDDLVNNVIPIIQV